MKLFVNLFMKLFVNLFMKLFKKLFMYLSKNLSRKPILTAQKHFAKYMRHSPLSILSLLMVLILLSSVRPALAGGKDDPALGMVLIDQLEMRKGDGNSSQVLGGQAWLGKDLQKLWLKFDVERSGGNTEDMELQALYSKAIAPLWDIQVGVRQDIKPTPSRTWAVIGLQGLAPYFFEVDAALFLDESNRTAFRFQAEYELLLTQKLILTPEMEFNFYGQNDAELGVGSGLSSVDAGLRLRYELQREFAPYIGLNWNKRVANSADFARSKGDDTEDLQWVIGVRAWF